MDEKNIKVLMARRPSGWVRETDFQIVEEPLPEIGDGQFLVRNRYLSLDPYMRSRMNDAKSYARSVAPGEVMVGETVGKVVASRHPGFPVGCAVLTKFGWQLYGIDDGTLSTPVEDLGLPLPAQLGIVGMPGVTAYVGLFDVAQPKSGETVVVSAAAGAVGSVVGQLARLHGCRAIGIAGGPEKCRYVVDELGFDACVDYKAGNVAQALARAAPDGIDVCFENVGGEIFDTVLAQLNPFSRIALCGMVSQYNAAELYGTKNLRSLLTNRVRLQGFIIFDHQDRWPVARAALAQAVREGRIRYRETVAQGIRSAPAAFIGMLKGQNLGKQLVKLD